MKALEASRASFLSGARHVGYWAWEQSTAPVAWGASCRFVDAVWVPSTFAAEAVRKIAPTSMKVDVIPHPVCVGALGADRPRFQLPQDRCLVLCAFDLKSTVARKNPFGALELYRRAVPAADDSILIFKASGSQAEPELFEYLRTAASDRDDVVFITQTFSEADMTRLIASVDIILSPHRSEGFGLVLAEAMLLGKAVVATGWSGNMDFMTPETAALIDFVLAPAKDPQGMYQGSSRWAEPDIGHGALLLKRLIDDVEVRSELGRRARRHAELFFDRAAWTARVRTALYEEQELSR
jgi:glycosyltransferase involved in cell wall biosynthesis